MAGLAPIRWYSLLVSVQSAGEPPDDAILKRLLDSDLKNGIEKEDAVQFCSAAGWSDCVTTVIRLEGHRFILNADDIQKPELRIAGFAAIKPITEVRVREFRKRLAEEG